MSTPTGVLWAGHLFDRGGYGNASRNYVLSLRSARIPVRIFNLGDVHGEIDAATAQLLREHAGVDVGRAPVGVVHSLPTHIPDVRFTGVSGTVLASIFETDGLPPGWPELSNRMDQVWVPSTFNRETYGRAGVRPEKLRVVPIPVDCEYFRPGIDRRPIPGASGFTFLYVFSFGWRKGFDLLLRAFLREFTSKDDVTLVLKVYPGRPRVSDLRASVLGSVPESELRRPDAPRVLVMSEPVPQDELRQLYASCDLLVCTDRASGWGMPCIEAMAMGKAAATISWSGCTEFMTDANSFLIQPEKELEPVDPRLSESYPIYANQNWAKVSEGEVRRVLRLAFEDRALLARKAEAGCEDVRSKFSIPAVGVRFREVLETFNGTAPLDGRPPSVSFRWKKRLKRLVRDAVFRVIPSLRT